MADCTAGDAGRASRKRRRHEPGSTRTHRVWDDCPPSPPAETAGAGETRWLLAGRLVRSPLAGRTGRVRAGRAAGRHGGSAGSPRLGARSLTVNKLQIWRIRKMAARMTWPDLWALFNALPDGAYRRH